MILQCQVFKIINISMLKTLVNSSLTCSKTVVTAASHIKIKHGQESCKFQFSKYKPPGGLIFGGAI